MGIGELERFAMAICEADGENPYASGAPPNRKNPMAGVFAAFPRWRFYEAHANAALKAMEIIEAERQAETQEVLREIFGEDPQGS